MSLLPVLLSGSVLKTAGILTVLSVDTTVFSMVVLLAASVLAFLRRPGYPLWEILPFGILAVVVLVGVAMSDAGDYQSIKARDFFLITCVIVACIPILVRDVRDLRGLVITWLLAGVIASLTTVLVGGSETLYGRAGIGEATLGPAYLAAAGLVVACAAWGERQIAWPVAIPVLAVSGIAVVTIGSRGPMLSAAAGVAAWVLLRGVLNKGTVIVAFAFGGAVLLGLNQASEESASRIFLYEDPGREELWAIAWTAFLDSPVLGMGWGDYSTFGWGNYPHNAFLEAGTELGIVGILTFLGVLSAGLVRSWGARSTAEVRVLAALAFGLLIGQQFSADLSNRVFWIAFVPTLLFRSIVTVGKPRNAGPAASPELPVVRHARTRI